MIWERKAQWPGDLRWASKRQQGGRTPFLTGSDACVLKHSTFVVCLSHSIMCFVYSTLLPLFFLIIVVKHVWTPQIKTEFYHEVTSGFKHFFESVPYNPVFLKLPLKYCCVQVIRHTGLASAGFWQWSWIDFQMFSQSAVLFLNSECAFVGCPSWRHSGS